MLGSINSVTFNNVMGMGNGLPSRVIMALVSYCTKYVVGGILLLCRTRVLHRTVRHTRFVRNALCCV